MNLTLLGGGRMGGAIACGAVASGVVAADRLTVTHASDALRRALPRARYLHSNVDAVAEADLVVLAVPGGAARNVLQEIAPALGRRTAVASIVAELDLSGLREAVSPGRPIFRAMPNTAIAVQRGMTYLCTDAPSDAVGTVLSLFEALGTACFVDETELHAVTSLTSCGIAYAFRYLQAASAGGAALGIEPKQALRSVCRTMEGALALLEAEPLTPAEQIDRVATPGGITRRGLDLLDREGFDRIVAAALKASL